MEPRDGYCWSFATNNKAKNNFFLKFAKTRRKEMKKIIYIYEVICCAIPRERRHASSFPISLLGPCPWDILSRTQDILSLAPPLWPSCPEYFFFFGRSCNPFRGRFRLSFFTLGSKKFCLNSSICDRMAGRLAEMRTKRNNTAFGSPMPTKE